MNRKRKNHMMYARFSKRAKSRDCDFCSFEGSDTPILKAEKHFQIVRNIFPYDVWDHAGVTDHLMLVPKRHVDAIGHFSPEEQAEFTKIIGQYDTKGYSVYARAKGSAIKSVVHQHTHLIKLDNKLKKVAFFIQKPRLFLYR